MIELRGSTWDHTRGYDPLPVTAAAYMAEHPDVKITWERRTLQDFAEMSIPQMAEVYDLIVLDHPWLGATNANGSLLALDRYLSEDVLKDQAENSVGKSNASYVLDGHQWGLAVDAACQVSAYRPDLLEKLGAEIPTTWDAVLALANRYKGQVATALMHVDTLPCFVTLCANAGEAPFTGDHVASRAVGRHALEVMRSLATVCHPGSRGWNPPQLLDAMSKTDEIIYCPLAFGYTNYARAGYRPNLIKFTNIPSVKGAILGGAGMVVTRHNLHPEVAADYAAFVARGDVQRGMYFEHGGQPGHRSAWLDEADNAACSNFFKDTLDTIDNAYLRPRYNGWIAVQDGACVILHQFVREGGNPDTVLDALDTLYGKSKS
jgi:multiple sugar transport system substrate-binding protein